jgi:Fe2+ transport system protein B
MKYKDLKNALKTFKSQGLTDIKLNLSQAELQAEYNRIVKNQATETKVEESQDVPEIFPIETIKPEESSGKIPEIETEVEESRSEEIFTIKHEDEEIGHLFENAYKPVEEDSTDIKSQPPMTSKSLIFFLFIAILIIALIFATEKVISNIKFLSDISKVSL